MRLQFDERAIPGEFQETEFKFDKLRNVLKDAGFATDGYKKDLQIRCKDNTLPLKVRIPKMEYGWLNKAKGMQQIACERGLLDPNKIYHAGPCKDKHGLGC
eukprot:2754066-Ditylum_brightwellii.AAC.1